MANAETLLSVAIFTLAGLAIQINLISGLNVFTITITVNAKAAEQSVGQPIKQQGFTALSNYKSIESLEPREKRGPGRHDTRNFHGLNR